MAKRDFAHINPTAKQLLRVFMGIEHMEHDNLTPHDDMTLIVSGDILWDAERRDNDTSGWFTTPWNTRCEFGEH